MRKKKSIVFSDLDNEDNNNSFAEQVKDEAFLPDDLLIKLEDSLILKNTLEKLSIQHQTVLTLHYQDEMTFDEIGKVLNKSLNTVKSQHRRAILELRKILDNNLHQS